MNEFAQGMMRLALPALACAMLAACVGGSAGTAGNSPGDNAVAYRTFGPNDYQSFIKNWDEGREPVRCAVLRSPQDWDALFAAAPVMGQQRPFSPPAALFAREQILVAARVIPAPAEGARPFTVQGVDKDPAGGLTLRYAFAAPSSASGYTIKNYVAVIVPRGSGSTVFVENGRKVCTVR